MAEITDVYLRIRYKQDGVIKEDDILDDIDMYDAIADMVYDGIDYEQEDELILKAYARNYYPLAFENESEAKEALFEVSEEKGIEEIYCYFCDFSLAMERIIFGKITLKIKEREVEEKIVSQEDYMEYFKKEVRKDKKRYSEEKIEELVAENLLERFSKYIKEEC